MKTITRLGLLFLCIGGFIAIGLIGDEQKPTAARMAEAADKFIDTLTDEQKKKAMLGFDDGGRVKWYFTPQQEKGESTRKGLRLDSLNDKQRTALMDLLKTGSSAKGYEQIVTIMSLENILKQLEKKGAMVRDPNWYFITFFGKPSKNGDWGWRFEGHHLSVNFTIKNGVIKSVTPYCFGANPAEVMAGDKKGLRPFPEIEDTARELIDSLNDDQRKSAKLAKHIDEIGEGLKAAKLGDPAGVKVSDLTEKQRETFFKLVKAYTDRMPDNVGALEFGSAKGCDPKKVYFSYSGETTKGNPYTYRIHGPTFLVEFLNVQADSAGNVANHIHSVWRHLPEDFE